MIPKMPARPSAGSFVLGRNWAALTSLAATHFDVHGKQADMYGEHSYR